MFREIFSIDCTDEKRIVKTSHKMKLFSQIVPYHTGPYLNVNKYKTIEYRSHLNDKKLLYENRPPLILKKGT